MRDRSFGWAGEVAAVAAVVSVLLVSRTTAADGDWPRWRRDGTLTAHQPLAGRMTKPPRVLAKHFIGAGLGLHQFADLAGTGSPEASLVVARGRLTAYDAKGAQLWEAAPAGHVLERVAWVEDLDGDGGNEVVALAGRVGYTRQAYLIFDGGTGAQRGAVNFDTGDFGWRGQCGAFVPGERGKQIFVVTSMRQAPAEGPPGPKDPDSPHESGAGSNGQVTLWGFDGSGESATLRRRWTWTPTEHPIEYPEVYVVPDLAGPGASPRGVVTCWCHVWTLDLPTGAVVSHAGWDPQGANHRHYGFNRMIDVDGDGALDYVNLALTKHVDVLRNVGGRLELAWTRGWPDSVTTEERSLRWPADPVLDLDGDGRLEIAAALFDGKTDDRWHLSLWDAPTGDVKGEALDLVPVAAVPLWGEGKGRALLCYRSDSINYDPPKAYELWRLHGGKLEQLWTSPAGPFLLNGTPPAAVHSDVDGDGRAEFFTATGTAGAAPQAWGLDGDGKIVAKPGQPVAPQPPGTSPPPPPPPASLPLREGTTVPHLLAADVDGDGGNELLLYDAFNVTVLRLEGETLRVVETFPSSEIPIVCDLLGDGRPFILTAGRAADRNLWVEARGPDTTVLWRYVFPDSAACGQYSSRPHYFTVGRFTGGKHLDVFTYSTKPAARTYVLDGRTGQPVWERGELPAIERHFQAMGGRAAVWDYNRDGADDVLFCNPDFYCAADGRNGDLLVGPVEIAKLVNWWAAYSSPAVLPHAGGETVVYLGSAYSSRCAISLDGTRGLWREFLPGDRWALRPPAEVFAEGLLPPAGDRGWRAAQAEADGTLVCFDVASGAVRWRSALATFPSAMVTGDVDGNGEADLLLGGHDGRLRALRDAGDRAQTVWMSDLGAPVGTPILADVNADGASDIAVSVGDGYVYVLGE